MLRLLGGRRSLLLRCHAGRRAGRRGRGLTRGLPALLMFGLQLFPAFFLFRPALLPFLLPLFAALLHALGAGVLAPAFAHRFKLGLHRLAALLHFRVAFLAVLVHLLAPVFLLTEELVAGQRTVTGLFGETRRHWRCIGAAGALQFLVRSELRRHARCTRGIGAGWRRHRTRRRVRAPAACGRRLPAARLLCIDGRYHQQTAGD